MRWFAACLLLLPGVVESLPGQEKPADGLKVDVLFGDGSLVKLTLQEEQFDIVTRYGKLTVPFADVRRIELGVRYPAGALQKIEDAIRRLGDSDFKKREAATTELLTYRELAYPHVRRAAMGGNPEVVKRARAILEDLKARVSAEKLALKEHDTIVTADFPIAGHIGSMSFKARSPLLGDVEVKLDQVRTIQRIGGGGESSLTLDAAKYGLPQETWMDTGIDVNGRLVIQARGTVDVMPNNPGQMIVGPDGARADIGGFGRQVRQSGVGPPGALIGRIGQGSPFLVGSNYDGTPGEGRLFLRAESSPWRVPMSGSFSVKVETGR